eukprot:m.17493 g.17493  ORF g.17493 m.17493 type:complete len:76 (-) comp7467_c0_seq1:8211-8438(-)
MTGHQDALASKLKRNVAKSNWQTHTALEDMGDVVTEAVGALRLDFFVRCTAVAMTMFLCGDALGSSMRYDVMLRG